MTSSATGTRSKRFSIKTARRRATKFASDIVSLHVLKSARLPDNEVAVLAARQERTLVTLDREFLQGHLRKRLSAGGLISLDLPNSLRPLDSIQAVVERYFVEDAPAITIAGTLVVLTADNLTIQPI